MSRTYKVGRNDYCPCGSGMKAKRCCAGAERDKGSRMMLFIVLAVVAGGIIAGIASFAGGGGSAPAGKVWSTEHGHYH